MVLEITDGRSRGDIAVRSLAKLVNKKKNFTHAGSAVWIKSPAGILQDNLDTSVGSRDGETVRTGRFDSTLHVLENQGVTTPVIVWQFTC